MTDDQLDQLAAALQLPEGAGFGAALAQAEGLVAALREIRTKVYVGIIDPILADHGVELPADVVRAP